MKFDCIIGNPPYSEKEEMLPIIILDKVRKISSNVIFLQPARWLQNPVLNKLTKYNFTKEICSTIKNIDIIPKNKMNSLFKIGMKQDGMIIHLDLNGGYDISKIQYVFNGIDYTWVIKNVVLPYIEKKQTLTRTNNNYKYKTRISRKNYGRPNFDLLDYSSTPKEFDYVEHKTKKEMTNFQNLLKENFFQYIISSIKRGQTNIKTCIPFFDCNEEWNFDRFVKEFDVPKKIQKQIQSNSWRV